MTAERFHFHRRNQLSTESVAEYVAELRRLSTHRDFDDHHNDRRSSRLPIYNGSGRPLWGGGGGTVIGATGLRSENIQRRSVLSMKYLTLKDALQTAQAMEEREDTARLRISFHEPVHKIPVTRWELSQANS